MKTKRFLTLLLVLAMIFTIGIPTGMADDSGYISASGDNDDSGVSHESRAYSSDNSYAEFNSSSDHVDYTFGSSLVPSNATIEGITVRLEAKKGGGNRTLDVNLISGGTSTSTKNTGSLTGSDKHYTLGGSSDTWGHTWTASEINSIEARVDATSGGNTIYLDHIQIKVTYSTGPITYNLTIDKEGNGDGTVTLNPAGGSYTQGTVVSLSAAPDATSTFDGFYTDRSWSYGHYEYTGKLDPEEVTMNSNKTIYAVFDEKLMYDLDIDKVGDGDGTVTLNPSGGTYDPGTVVSLSAAPDATSTFDGFYTDRNWTGGYGGHYEYTGKLDPAEVTMDNNKTIYALFDDRYVFDHIDIELEGSLKIDRQIDGVSEPGYPKDLTVTVSNPYVDYVVDGVTYHLDSSDFSQVGNELRSLGLSFFRPTSVRIRATLTDGDSNTYSFDKTFGEAGIQAAYDLCPGSESSGTKGLDFLLEAEDIENEITNTVTFETTTGGTIGGGTTDIVHTGVLDGEDSPTPPAVSANSGYHFLGWTKNGGSTYYTSAQVDAMTINDDVTFTAQFEEDLEFRVHNSNGHGGDHGFMRVTYNGTVVDLDAGETETFIYYSTAGDLRVDFIADSGWIFNYFVIDDPAAHTSDNPAYFDMATYAGQNGANNMLSINPKWTTSVTYTVTYNGNGNDGGTAPVDTSSPYNGGVEVTVLGEGDLSLTGYTFDGWNTAANGSGDDYAESDSFTMPAANVVLYAQWTKNSYNVRFFQENGTTQIGTTQSVQYMGNATAETAPAKTGYHFVGWNDGTSTYTSAQVNARAVTADTDYTAEYEKNSYNVKFFQENGTTQIGTTQSVDYMDSATAETAPAKTGYHFVGWNDGTSTYTSAQVNARAVTADTDYTAEYEKNSYNVKFFQENGTTQIGTTQSVDYMDSATAETAPAKTGYHFVGWNDGTSTYTSAQVNARAVTADTDYTAEYEKNSYNVKFFQENGTTQIGTTQSVDYMDSATAETAPAKTGYHFVGWNDGTSTYTSAQVNARAVTADTDYTAEYEKNSYNVKFFQENGTTQIGTTQSVDYMDSATAETAPAKTGYHFVGWNDGTSTYTSAQVNARAVTADTDYTAEYEKNSYNVKFFQENGTTQIGTTQSVDYMDSATAETAPAKTGYHFVGWNDGTSTYTSAQVNARAVTADTDYTAEYEKNSYNVKFFQENGTTQIGTTQSVDYMDSATAETAPAKTGYHFVGWNDGTSTYTSAQVNARAVTADTDYTAEYEKNSYNVKFFQENGTTQIGTTQSVDYMDSATAETAPAKTGYHFVGWNDGTSTYTSAQVNARAVTADTDYTAEYEIDTFTVTFENYDGSEIDQQSVDYMDFATAPSDPSRGTGWYFMGWSSDGGSTVVSSATVNSTAVTADITYVAQYEYRFQVKPNAAMVNGEIKVTYNGEVRYVPAGGSTTFTAVDGADLVYFQGEPDTGYEFLYWNSVANRIYSADNGLRSKNIYSSAVFTPYAHFTAIEYDIIYVMNGGTNDPSNPATYTVEDSTITLADPTKAGYNFTGWTPTDNIPAGSVGDKTFTATWSDPIEYTITYVMDGGTNDPSNPATYTVESAEIVLVDPTKAGYNFTGWTPTDNIPAGSVGDKTFTATWSDPIEYTITYVMDGGTNDPSNPATYTVESAEIVLADPTKAGYNFTGWTPTDTIPTGSTGNKTFTATWSDPIEYTITYIMNGGTNNPANPDTYTVEDDEIVLVNPARANFGFTGWTPEGVIPAGSTGNRTFEADWSINTFTVTFIDFDGTVLGTDVVGFGGDADAPDDPEREGYDFTGWDTDYTNVTSDLTVQAEYTQQLFTVTWANWDGTELEVDEDVPYGDTPSFDGDEPTRESSEESDFTFDGWSPTVNPVTGDVTYTAEYSTSGRAYVVRWENWDGTLLEEDSIVYGETPTYDGDAPERPNEDETSYTFFEWSPVVEPVTGDVTYIAQYTENVDEEPIPQAGPSSWLWWLLLIPGIGLIILLLAFWLRIIPIVEKVTKNPDGTFTVLWGYENRKGRKVEFDEEDDSTLTALEGSIISSRLISPEEGDTAIPPLKFEKGRVENVLETIVSADAKVQWKIRSAKKAADMTKEEK